MLGDRRLYETSAEVLPEEAERLRPVTEDLRDTLLAFRARYGAGRAIAAPQIGVLKRLIYRNIGGQETVYINPILTFPEEAEMEVLDDCMSFPGLKVWVRRRRRCRVDYRDLDWNACTEELEGDLSELFQHEYDHLDGVLATMRAVNEKAFVMSPPKNG